MKTVSRILLAILTLVVLIVSCSRNGSETESNEKSASETVIESGFNKLTVDEYKALVNSHELVLVDFFATWCGPCIKEMPSIKRAEKILEDYGYTFLLVSDETITKISKFKNERNFDFNFLKSSKSFETLGVYSMPTSYIFDENGNIIETIVGAIEWDSEEMINKLKML